MVLEFDNLHALTLIVLPDEAQPALLQPLDERRVDLVPVAVALEDRARAAAALLAVRVQRAQAAPLAAGLEQRRAQAQPHRRAHRGLVDFGHEHDDAGISSRATTTAGGAGAGAGGAGTAAEFLAGGARNAAHVARELDDRDLHAETDAEIGGVVLAGPLGGRDHALCAALAEAAGDQDAGRGADGVPGLVELGRVARARRGLEVLRVNPLQVQLALAPHGRVLE